MLENTSNIMCIARECNETRGSWRAQNYVRYIRWGVRFLSRKFSNRRDGKSPPGQIDRGGNVYTREPGGSRLGRALFPLFCFISRSISPAPRLHFCTPFSTLWRVDLAPAVSVSTGIPSWRENNGEKGRREDGLLNIQRAKETREGEGCCEMETEEYGAARRFSANLVYSAVRANPSFPLKRELRINIQRSFDTLLFH